MRDRDLEWLARFAGDKKRWAPQRELKILASKKDVDRLYAGLYGEEECRGVYAILWNRPVGRCVGRSRILYIGESHGLWTSVQRRAECGFNPTYRSKGIYDDLKRLRQLAKRKEGRSTRLFFTYLRMRRDRVKSKEQEILHKYREKYAELPPFNRKGP